jgi:thiol:disulfide interchange protein DsbC
MVRLAPWFLAVLSVLSPTVAAAGTVAEQPKPRLARTDVKSIPLADAIRIGGPDAKKNVVVFSDPDCRYCSKLHVEIKAVAAADPDVAFHVKMFSRRNDPSTVRKAAAVACSKSEKMLEDAYARKDLPEPACGTGIVEETARLAARLTLMGAPAMILPDGTIVRGYRDAAAIRALLAEAPP